MYFLYTCALILRVAWRSFVTFCSQKRRPGQMDRKKIGEEVSPLANDLNLVQSEIVVHAQDRIRIHHPR